MPQLPADEGEAPAEPEPPEEALERLAHLEQLVVQLKELIRDKDTLLSQKDTDLTNKDAQLKVKNKIKSLIHRKQAPGRRSLFCPLSFSCPQHEKEEFEARFTKLKLQAKAKMASLNKQISDLKGSGPPVSAPLPIKSDPPALGDHKHVSLSDLQQSPDTSFSGVGSAAEEELQELKNKLSEEEGKCRELQERLQSSEQLLQEKEAAHAEQVTCCMFNSWFLRRNHTAAAVVDELWCVLVPSCRNCRLWCVRRTCVSRSRSGNTRKSC